MKEKISKLRQIIEEHNRIKVKPGQELFFDFFVNPEIHAILMIGPIDIGDNISHLLAERIAKKNGIDLTQYDFSGNRWSEPRDYRPVFSINLSDNEQEFENSAQKLSEASKELSDSCEKIVKRSLNKL